MFCDDTSILVVSGVDGSGVDGSVVDNTEVK